MGDLIGFEGYLNASTPFNSREHNALWKGDRRYNDFAFGNDELPFCDYPRFYGDDGTEVLNLSSELVGCRDSEFDQYGEVAAFGNYPEWYVYTLGCTFSLFFVRHASKVSPFAELIHGLKTQGLTSHKYADSYCQGNVKFQSSHSYKTACVSGNQRFSAKLSISLV